MRWRSWPWRTLASGVIAGAVVARAATVHAQAMIPGPDDSAPESSVVSTPPPPVIADPTKRTVLGVIGEKGTTNPIAGATILDERGDIAISDVDGYFSITVRTTSRELTIAAPGYAAITVKIPRSNERLRVQLSPTRGAEVIEIVDKAPEQAKPLSYKLTADEIRVIPGAGNDILRAVTALPGVARIPFSFGGLVLRGMNPRDSGVYLDGIEVPIAFHFGGIVSFYPGGMLEDLQLWAGGSDASYGRVQGGIVALTTREPRTDRWRVGGSIGLLDSSLQIEGPLSRGGGIIAGIRRSYLDVMVRPFAPDDVPLPSYTDFQVKTGWGSARDRGRITPMIFGSVDRVANDETAITSSFVRLAMPYHRQWGNLGLRTVPYVGINDLRFSEEGDEAFGEPDSTFSRPMFPWGIRAELVRDYAWGHLRGGAELSGGYLAQSSVDNGAEPDEDFGGDSTIAWVDIAMWGELRYVALDERLVLKPGVRIERYGLTTGRAQASGRLTDGGWLGTSFGNGPQLVLDPRFNASFKLDSVTMLRAAAGRFHQPPIPADVDPTNGNPGLDSSYTDQYSLGIERTLRHDIFASVTAYFHYGRDVAVRVPEPGPFGEDPDPNLGGLGPTFELLLERQVGIPFYRETIGRARTGGVEVLAKKTTDTYLMMLTYTFAIAQRTHDPATALLTQETWRPFELDQRHNVQLIATRRWPKWRLGARLQLASGNPYTPTTDFTDFGEPIGDPFSGDLPMFVGVNLRADRRWHRCWGDINLYIDLQNAIFYPNVEGREFDYQTMRDEDIPGWPFLPFIGVEFLPLL